MIRSIALAAGLVLVGIGAANADGMDARSMFKVDGNLREYLAYVPDKLPPGGAIVFALHGTGGSGDGMRKNTGDEFDRLADAHGFVVVYPTGFENSWDDCRKTDPLPAKQQKIDDIAFFRQLIQRMHDLHGSDPRRVFIVGYSNGAQMAMRVALEAPDMVTAIAAVSANLPVPDNSVCGHKDKPVSVLLMDGTADPVNPFNGGEVHLSTKQSRGFVHSTQETADYWARLAGDTAPPMATKLPHRNPADPTSVEIFDWHEAGKPEVKLYKVNGGGHVVPNPHFKFPALLGAVTKDIDAPQEIWNFFAAQMK